MLGTEELQALEERAMLLASQAGEILLEYFKGPLSVEYKGDRTGDDPVTEADRKVENFLTMQLAKSYPDHAVVGEEGAGQGSRSAPLTWVLDPLDGTTNFYNGLPLFACSIALLEHGVPVVAAVFVPWPGAAAGKVLHAHKDGGAWESGQPLRVASERTPVAGRVMILPGIASGRFRSTGGLRKTPGERRSVGSIAFELSLAADGTYQYVVFPYPKSWDVAAGILLVQEAGGEVLHRQPGSRIWRTFTTFAPGAGDSVLTQDQLRNWGSTILAGNKDIVKYVGDHLHPRSDRIPDQLKGFFRGVSQLFH